MLCSPPEPLFRFIQVEQKKGFLRRPVLHSPKINNMSNIHTPFSICTLCKTICPICKIYTSPCLYMQRTQNHTSYASQNGPYPGGKAHFEILLLCRIYPICTICQVCICCILCIHICSLPRVHLTGRRSTDAVDMFGRAKAVTFNLITSGKA